MRLSTEIIKFDDAAAADDHPVTGITMGHIRRWFDEAEQNELAKPASLRDGLKHAIRAAKLALFVVNKHCAMPNGSWKTGFDDDLRRAEVALQMLTPNAEGDAACALSQQERQS